MSLEGVHQARRLHLTNEQNMSAALMHDNERMIERMLTDQLVRTRSIIQSWGKKRLEKLADRLVEREVMLQKELDGLMAELKPADGNPDTTADVMGEE